MRYEDWGDRCPRWAGVRSVLTSVAGVPVHYLVGDPTGPVEDAPTHVLVPPMTASAAGGVDLVAAMRELGPVVSADPPGTLAGHTGAPYRRGSRPKADAAFVRALLEHLNLHHVVLHSWSTGGLVALSAAELAPSRVSGLVLAAPTLPWRRTSRYEALAWNTVGRAALAVGVPAARLALRVPWVREQARRRRRGETEEVFTRVRAAAVGGDPELVSPEQVAVYADELASLDPRRLAGTVTAFTSAITAMFIEQQSTMQLLDRVPAPVLLLWGTNDPLIDQPSYRLHAQRPGWAPHPLDGAGHLLAVERPNDYVAAVRAWSHNMSLANLAGGQDRLFGAILWASFPTSGAGLDERPDLAVLSVGGTRDGLSAPDDLRERRGLLPIDDAEAAAELARLTTAFLDEVG